MSIVSCQKTPVKPTVPTPPGSLPPPAAAGAVVATVPVAVPAGHEGHRIFAGLKRGGRIVARGEATIAGQDRVEIPLRALEAGPALAEGEYELWVTLDRDGWLSCYPGFGDLFIRAPWTLPGPSPLPEWRERKLSAPAKWLTIHYHRYDQNYDSVGLWSWDSDHRRTPPENELLEVGRDDYGLIFQLDLGEYGDAQDGPARIGLLPRLASDWNRKDGEDRYWTPALGGEVYLIGTRNQIWGNRPDLAPHIAAAYLDSAQQVVIQLSQLVAEGEVRPTAIHITDDQGHRFAPVATKLSQPKSTFVEAVLFDPLDVAHRTFTVQVAGYNGTVPALPRGVLDDSDLFCEEEAKLGAEYSKAGTTFRVFAPTMKSAQVVLYDESSGEQDRATHPLTRQAKGIWETTVAGDLAGKFYTYAVTGLEANTEREVVDICAINTVNSARRARITDLEATNPPGWEQTRGGPPLKSPVDMIVYEMHVRDFTMATNSPARPEYRGKFLGFAEAADHLVELGVTHVQLMPVQDFENDEGAGVYNWGYMTVGFWSPEGWFATNLHDDSRIREFKTLVAALHARGLGVILDVVYNHTGSAAAFNVLVPRYYYRFNPDDSYSNGSGCGNDFRTESPMGRKFLIDSLRYWAEEYGVDGFRFDLMAMLDLDTMKELEKELRRVNPHILLYGEPWSAAPTPLKGKPTDKQHLRGTKIGAFNDSFRNALKGAPDGDGNGFIQDGSERGTVVNGLMGSWTLWSPTPAHSINYLTCHDNLVLFDKLKLSMPGATEPEIIEMMKLGYLLLFTAQGVPFLHGGEEFARTKQGHHNSYNAPDEINQVDWSLKQKHAGLFSYVRDLIALRKAHPIFRIRAKEQVAAWLEVRETDDPNTIQFILDGRALDDEPWKQICVLANAAASLNTEFDLPPGPWYVAFDHAGKVAEPRAVENQVRVRYKSGMILYQP